MTMKNTCMIEVNNLQKIFNEKTAVKDMTFDVDEGEIFGFLGPNGAGKTTTIKMLTGRTLPTYGSAKIMGKDIIRESYGLESKTGIVPDKSNLYERLNIIQNLEFFCRLYGIPTSVANDLLEEIGLSDEKKTQVKKLSKGTRQKILLIRALLHKPRLLFLDEPTSGLDPTSAAHIHNILMKLNKEGTTIFLTSHNMEEVEKLCGRVAFINSGSIVEMGAVRDLKLKYKNDKMKLLVKSGNALEELRMEMSGEHSAIEVSNLIREGRLVSIHSCEPTLADIFMSLTGREIA